MRRGAIFGVFALFFSSLLACGSSSSDPAPASDAGPPAQELGKLSAWAIDHIDNPEAPSPGLGGTRFIFQQGTTEREREASADGHVLFEDVDWSAGPVTLSAFSEGRVINTVVGITPDNLAKYAAARATQKFFPAAGGELTLLMQKRDAGNTVQLTGEVVGKLDAANWIVWTPSRGPNGMRGKTPQFDIAVLKDQPLQLVAWEFAPLPTPAEGGKAQQIFRWSTTDVPALSQNTMQNYDWGTAKPLTATTVHGTVRLPNGGGGAFAGVIPNVAETTLESGGVLIGEWESVVGGADGTFNFSAQKVTVEIGTDHVVSATQANMPNGSSSLVTILGELQEGMTFADFLVPATPARASFRVGEEIPLGDLGPLTAVYVQAFDAQSGDLVWSVRSPLGFPIPTEAAFPSLPADVMAKLPVKLNASILSLANPLRPDFPESPSHAARSAPFALER